MTPKNQELLRKIEAFAFDEPGTTFTFAQRLARENGWSAAYTRRTMTEYRRFVFLAMTAQSPVCPSEAVDQVWHQHLTFTQNYWEDFCGKVLGGPLHHGPTRGGSKEAAKHHDMYAQTLAAYREAFGEEPPADIWEPGRLRFGDGASYVRVNRRKTWLIPKPRWLQLAALLLGGAMPAWAGLEKERITTTAEASSSLDFWNLPGPQFLEFYFFLAVAAVIAGVFFRRRAKGPADPGKLPPDPYVVATLAGGPDRAVYAAVAELTRQKLVSAGGPEGIARVDGAVAPSTLHPFEQAVLAKVPTTICSMREIREGVKVETDALRAVLIEQKLLVNPATWPQRITGLKFLMGGVVAVGAIKLMVGVSRGKPIGWLLLLTGALVVVWYYLSKRPVRTIRGQNALYTLRDSYDRTQMESEAFAGSGALTGMLPLAIGLYGLPFLTASPLAGLQQDLVPLDERKLRGEDSATGQPHFDSSSSSGGSSSSSGCSTSSSDSGGSSGDSGGSGCSSGSSGCGGCGGGGGGD